MSYELSAMSCKKLTWRKILGGLEFSGCIFGMFCIWMLCSSFAFRPQVDVIGLFMEPESVAEPVALAAVEPVEPALDSRAVALSKMGYGIRENSMECIKAEYWCAINRCESPLYPNTIEEVCSQPGQWMGYSEDNPVIDRYYDLAVEVLEAWENGGVRNLPADCLWFTWNGPESITFRTKFEGGNEWRVE